MFIITLLTTFALPRISNFLGSNLRGGATEVAGFLQSAYQYSVMRHERIRVRLNFSDGGYWVESYNDAPLIPLLNENTKVEDALKQFRDEEESMGNEKEEEKKALEEKKFKKVEGTGIKESTLPSQIHFKGVYTSTEGKVVDRGEPWIDFFPGGFVPKTIIYVSNDSDQVFSIILEPIGGRSKVERGEVSPNEV
jgi:hypothetical protein